MNTENASSPQQEFSYPQAKSQRRHLVLAVAAVPLVIVAALWFGPSPVVPNHVKKFVRDGNGQLKEVDGDGDKSAIFEAQAGKIEATNSFNSMSATTRSGDARFRFAHVAVLNRSDHLLLKRASAELLKELKKLEFVERLEFYPVGTKPADGEMAPDVYVSLDLGEFKESGFLLKHDIEAKIEVTAGRVLVQSNAHYTDNMSPPIVDFHVNGTLEHKSTTTGLTSSAAKYKLAAENIAKQIAEKISGNFTTWIKQRGTMSDLPADFYPEYRKPLELTFLTAFNAESLTAAHGLMTRNESIWQFQSDRDVKELLTDIRDQLTADGWNVLDLNISEFISHLRIKNGSVTLMVFPEPKRSSATELNSNEESKNPVLKKFYVQYTDRMTLSDLTTTLQAILDTDKPSVDLLTMFHRNLTKEQRQQLLGLFKQQPPKSIRAWLTIAEIHRANNDDIQSRSALVRAWFLLRTLGNQVDYPIRIRESLKKLDGGRFTKPEIDETVLRELGFVRVTTYVKPVELIVGVDEPAVFYGLNDNGNLPTLTYRCVDHGDSFRASYVKSAESTRSWGDGSVIGEDHPTMQFVNFEGICRVEFRIVKLPDQKRFKITGVVHPLPVR